MTSMIISALPDDVLGAIFSQANDVEFPGFNVAPPSIVILSHVSSRWRALILSTPLLWSTVQIIVPNIWDPVMVDRIMRQCATRALEWIKRSGSTALRVSIAHAQHVSIPNNLDHAKLFAPIIEVLSVTLNRLEALFFTIDSPFSYIYKILATLKPKAVSLQALYIQSMEGRQTAMSCTEVAVPLLASAPLSKLYLMNLPGLPLRQNFALEKLEVLDLDEAIRLSRVLPRCTNLVSCTLHLSQDRIDIYTPETSISMPQLQHLKLILRWRPTGGYQFPHLNALLTPSIKSFTYLCNVTQGCDGTNARNWDRMQILPFILRHSTTLSHFITNPYSYVPEDLSLFLGNLPSLKCLHLIPGTITPGTITSRSFDTSLNQDLNDAFLDRFTAYENPLCPHLEEFVCQVKRNTFSTNSVSDFIARKQSHIAGVDSLKRVAFTFGYSMAHSDRIFLRAECRKILQDGLDAKFYD